MNLHSSRSHTIFRMVWLLFILTFSYEFVLVHDIKSGLYRLLRAGIKLKMKMLRIPVMLFVYRFWYASCNKQTFILIHIRYSTLFC